MYGNMHKAHTERKRERESGGYRKKGKYVCP